MSGSVHRSRHAGASPMRALLAVLGVLVRCAGSAAAGCGARARPFGSHPQPLAPATLQPRVDAGGARPRDRGGVRRLGGALSGAGAARRASGACAAAPGAPAHVVSEGQGYGMVIVALMAGHDPRRRSGSTASPGTRSTTPAASTRGSSPGRRTRAAATCRAATPRPTATSTSPTGSCSPHAQWGSGGAVDYLGAARRVLAGALAEDVHPRTRSPHARRLDRPGARWSGTRPSDWMPGHFRAFAAATGDARWERGPARASMRLVAARAAAQRAPPRLRGARPPGARRATSRAARRALLLERLPHAVADRDRRGAVRRRPGRARPRRRG